jgi:opacity protein-like surface antigen
MRQTALSLQFTMAVAAGLSVMLSSSLSMVAPTIAVAQVITTEEERARERELERNRQVREREAGQVEADRRDDRRRRSEMYVAGFGGYTFGHGFNDVEGTGALSGTDLGDVGLKNSGVYGAKLGYFLPDRLNWLGFEVEGFNTTPHFEESNIGGVALPGSNLRVTTLAFNAIARAKLMCERDYDDDRGRAPRRVDTDYRSDFCRLQPYIGAGLGVFFARASSGGTSASDNGVPGFNGLAGVLYYLTRGVAVFGEYKYNRANFDFDNIGGTGAGLSGTYSVSHVVGGLSFHF